MSDVCTGWKTKEEEEFRCRVLSGYAIICQEAGANTTGWRDQTHCGEALFLPSSRLSLLSHSAVCSALLLPPPSPWPFGLDSSTLVLGSKWFQTDPLPSTPPLSNPLLLLSAHFFLLLCFLFSYFLYVYMCVSMCLDSCRHVCKDQRTGTIYFVLLFVWWRTVTFLYFVCMSGCTCSTAHM